MDELKNIKEKYLKQSLQNYAKQNALLDKIQDEVHQLGDKIKTLLNDFENKLKSNLE